MAISEMRGFAKWLRDERLPNANDSFALGSERYRELLRVSELIEMAPEEILALGLRELKA
jgi:uncharacterized protein (DUF885 family)